MIMCDNNYYLIIIASIISYFCIKVLFCFNFFILTNVSYLCLIAFLLGTAYLILCHFVSFKQYLAKKSLSGLI